MILMMTVCAQGLHKPFKKRFYFCSGEALNL